MADERQGAGEPSPWWGEHVHRYDLAIEELREGALVLDVACGTGYGTARMARGPARLVVGGDFDFGAVRDSRDRWRELRAGWARLDASLLPFQDRTFDLVTSFETIEHTRRYREMARELARVVREDGVVLLSTPNVRVTSPDGIVRNPFHAQEFSAEEFQGILCEAFRDVRLFGQRYIRYVGRSGLRAGVAKALEWLLYRRGVRKLPIAWQDALMRGMGGVPMYPTPLDFALVNRREEIETSATLFAVCRR